MFELYAEVIINSDAIEIDRPFTYKVKEELLDIINYCYDTNYLTFSDIPKELIKEYIISEIGSIFSFETSNIDIKEVHCEE